MTENFTRDQVLPFEKALEDAFRSGANWCRYGKTLHDFRGMKNDAAREYVAKATTYLAKLLSERTSSIEDVCTHDASGDDVACLNSTDKWDAERTAAAGYRSIFIEGYKSGASGYIGAPDSEYEIDKAANQCADIRGIAVQPVASVAMVPESLPILDILQTYHGEPVSFEQIKYHEGWNDCIAAMTAPTTPTEGGENV
jgi:hypothetical protein